MTIQSDMDAALGDAWIDTQRQDKPGKPAKWRIGPGALTALAGMLGLPRGDMPTRYRGIEIEPVEAPSVADAVESWTAGKAYAFNGFELVI